MGFILDNPSQLTFFIATGLLIVFTIFTIISITIIVKELNVSKVKVIFFTINLILVVPSILSLVIFISYLKTKDNLKVDDLLLYKEQFVLIDENLDIKYSVITKENKYYKYEALLYNIQKDDKSSDIKQFVDLCLNEDLKIECAVKYDSKTYLLFDSYYFYKIFNVETDHVLINDEKFYREKLYDINEFNYIGSNQNEVIENDEVSLFVKKLVDNHINYYDTKYLENNEVNVIIKDKFPLTITKYKNLLESFDKFEKENNLYKINIIFDNHEIKYDKLKKEIKK